MNNKFVIIGGSSELAIGLSEKLADYSEVLNISRKLIKSEHKNIKFLKVKDYSATEFQKIMKLLDKKQEHTFLFMNGITDSKAFYKMNEKEIKNILNVNLEIPILATNLIIKEFMFKKTHYIYFTSSRALLGDRGISLYSSSKSALIYFVKSLSLEYSKFKQFFFAISLGVFDGGLVKEVKDKKLKDILNRSAINSYVNIDELAQSILYASKTTSGSGSVIKVDNGYF